MITILWRVITCLYLMVGGIILLYKSKLSDLYSIDSFKFCKHFLFYIFFDTILNITISKKIRYDSLIHHIWSFIGISIHIYNNIIPPLWFGAIGIVECITVSRVLLLFGFTKSQFSLIRKYLTIYIRIPTILMVLISSFTIFNNRIPLSSFYVCIFSMVFLILFDIYCLYTYQKNISNNNLID